MTDVIVEVLPEEVVSVETSTVPGVDVEVLLDDQPVIEVPVGSTDVVEVIAGIKGDPGAAGPAGPQGPQGVAGPAGGAQTLNTNISVATSLAGTRTFTHNLGWTPAGVLFFDSAGNQVSVQIKAVSATQITIYSDLPFSGTIYLS